MNNKLILATLGLCALTTASFAQGTGSEGYFEIYNGTSDNVVVGFYTNDGDGWSANWLSQELNPDENATAEFSNVSGYCDQHISVGWLGENGNEVMDDPISIDICASSNVYLEDNEIYFD